MRSKPGLPAGDACRTPPPFQPLVDKSRLVVAEPKEELDARSEEWTTKWGRFLEGAEKVVYCSLVIKKAGLFSSKKRQLILTTTPRLLYVDAEKMILKGNIPWSPQLQVVLKNRKEFVLKTVGRGGGRGGGSVDASRRIGTTTLKISRVMRRLG